MFCIHCGSEIPDGSVFCPICGQRIEGAFSEPDTSELAAPGETLCSSCPNVPEGESVPGDAPVREPADPEFGIVAGEPAYPCCQIPPEEPAYPGYGIPGEEPAYPGYGISAETPAYPGDGGPAPEPSPEKPKKGKGLKTALVFGCMTLILAAAVFVLWRCFGADGDSSAAPVDSIADAFRNTFISESYTMEYTMETDGVESRQFSQLMMDLEKREMIRYNEITSGGTSFISAMYDGYAITGMSGGPYYAYEAGDDPGEIFELCETLGDDDFSLISYMEDEGLFEELEKAVDVDLDAEALSSCLETYLDQLNDEAWLEEYAGFRMDEEDGVDLYCFDVDLYTFVCESIKEFKDSFVDEAEYEKVLKQLEELEEKLKGAELELIFGIDGEHLVRMEVFGRKDGAKELDIEIKISNIGTTEIDTEMLAEMLAEADDSLYNLIPNND